ncbi:hypothetical protein G3N57_02015 [Paraburkholderia sp. Se-20369]|nr:hypothetical protein [Paraburkholderia sp. Se-20369]
MVKTLGACVVLCIAAAALARFHGAVANWIAPSHTIAPVAQEPNQRPTVALGVAKSGWSVLFNH